MPDGYAYGDKHFGRAVNTLASAFAGPDANDVSRDLLRQAQMRELNSRSAQAEADLEREDRAGALMGAAFSNAQLAVPNTGPSFEEIRALEEQGYSDAADFQPGGRIDDAIANRLVRRELNSRSGGLARVFAEQGEFARMNAIPFLDDGMRMNMALADGQSLDQNNAFSIAGQDRIAGRNSALDIKEALAVQGLQNAGALERANVDNAAALARQLAEPVEVSAGATAFLPPGGSLASTFGADTLDGRTTKTIAEGETLEGMPEDQRRAALSSSSGKPLEVTVEDIDAIRSAALMAAGSETGDISGLNATPQQVFQADQALAKVYQETNNDALAAKAWLQAMDRLLDPSLSSGYTMPNGRHIPEGMLFENNGAVWKIVGGQPTEVSGGGI